MAIYDAITNKMHYIASEILHLKFFKTGLIVKLYILKCSL